MANQYGLTGRWGPRVETVEDLGVRALTLIPSLQDLGSCFKVWYQSNRYDGSSELFRRDLAHTTRFTARNVCHNDDGTPNLHEGYWPHFYNEPPTFRGLNFWSLDFKAGGSTGLQHLQLSSNGTKHSPTPDCVTYDTMEGALSAITDSFEPDICGVWSSALIDLLDNPSPRGSQVDHYWMVTLSPRFARFVVPPASVIHGYRPNGSLFMTATMDAFSTDNPDHLAATQVIYDLLTPLDFRPVFYPRPG